MNEDILDTLEVETGQLRRRALLPIWIKIFIWIFLIFAAITLVAVVLGLLGMHFSLAFYGLETMQPLSTVGLIIMTIFLYKGIVAFGLWTEKEWAVNLAISDAIIGILACVFVMFVLPKLNPSYMRVTSIRLELIPLILYLIKMWQIKSEWKERIAFKKSL